MNFSRRLSCLLLALPLLASAGTTQATGPGGPIPAGAFVTYGVVTSDIVLTTPGYVAAGNAVTVTLLGLQHDFAGDLKITLSYVSSTGVTLQSVDVLNRIGATTANPYGTAADFGNNQGNGDNYIFNSDYTGNLWSVAACSDSPACTTPYGDADSLPGVSTDKLNNGQYFTSTTGGVKTNLSYAFAGLNLTGGTWRLTITDSADPNVGSFIGWQISIATVSSPTPVTISSVAGTPQSTTVSTAFATALQAKVLDAYSSPVAGVTVTFSAPTSGASALFSGSSTATAVTNASGIAISPVPTANATAGAYTVSATTASLTPASFSLTNTGGAVTPTTFTTYLGTYGSGVQTYSGSSVVLPVRAYAPGGASQISSFLLSFNSTSTGSTEYQIYAHADGVGGYALNLQNLTTSAPWPLLPLNPSGTTVTLTTPIVVAAMQVTAYRFALVGNEFQLDLTLLRTDSFNDQLIMAAVEGNNAAYSAPWYANNGQWSAAGSSTSPAVKLSTTTLDFGPQSVGSGVTQNLTVTNTGTAALTISSVQISGTNSSDYTATNGCTASVAPGASCVVIVKFTPSSAGSRTATLSVADNASDSPQTVTLTGSGAAVTTPTTFTTYLGSYGSGFQTLSGTSVVVPLRAYAPSGASQISSLLASFNATTSGTVEYQIYARTDGAGGYTLTLQNLTTALPWPPLNLTPGGVTVTLPAPIAVGSMQITAYRFALVGNEFQLDLTLLRTDAFNDQIVMAAIQGNNAAYSAPWFAANGQWTASAAVTSPAVTLSSTALNFGSQSLGSSANQTLTVTNSGTAALLVSSIQLSGTNAADFSATNGCTTSVAPGSNCTIALRFNPSATGSRTATLSIVDNATGSPHTASLTGVGSASAGPTTFTTYFAPYGSAAPTFTGPSAVLPLRCYVPTGASQIAYFWTNFNSTATGATEFQIFALSDGAGNYILHMFNGTSNAPAWPFLTMNASGNTVSLTSPITLGTMQITAYRFALAGNEFQLDLTVNRSGSFSDQIVVLASYGQNYTSPWNAVDALWSNP